MDTTNRFGNWIEDINRWKLPQPPEWALGKLWDFDHMLVLIPSKMRREYLLARRRQYSAGMGDVALMENKHPDTNMCMAHNVMPIAPLRFKHGLIHWQAGAVDELLDELRRRDTWELTGGPDGRDPDAAWKVVEDHEASVEKRERHNLRDMFYHMARDAYRSLKARTGQRNKNAWDGNRLARVNAARGQRIMSRPTSRGSTH